MEGRALKDISIGALWQGSDITSTQNSLTQTRPLIPLSHKGQSGCTFPQNRGRPDTFGREFEYSLLRENARYSITQQFCCVYMQRILHIMVLMLFSKVIASVYISTYKIKEILWIHRFSNSWYSQT